MILQFKITKQVDIKRQGEKLIFYNNLFKQNKITKNIEVLIIDYYNNKQFATLGYGEIFGELDCFSNQIRHFTVQASSMNC